MVYGDDRNQSRRAFFQYSLCRVVLMVGWAMACFMVAVNLSVLALSSRFDGQPHVGGWPYSCYMLSVLALSSRFDGRSEEPWENLPLALLSVLALSSRFDGRVISFITSWLGALSVLALSSRFDGLIAGQFHAVPLANLSVLALSSRFDGRDSLANKVLSGWCFQYSLCRVVLMVTRTGAYWSFQSFLSVLALSSRFDGHSITFSSERV